MIQLARVMRKRRIEAVAETLVGQEIRVEVEMAQEEMTQEGVAMLVEGPETMVGIMHYVIATIITLRNPIDRGIEGIIAVTTSDRMAARVETIGTIGTAIDGTTEVEEEEEAVEIATDLERIAMAEVIIGRRTETETGGDAAIGEMEIGVNARETTGIDVAKGGTIESGGETGTMIGREKETMIGSLIDPRIVGTERGEASVVTMVEKQTMQRAVDVKPPTTDLDKVKSPTNLK